MVTTEEKVGVDEPIIEASEETALEQRTPEPEKVEEARPQEPSPEAILGFLKERDDWLQDDKVQAELNRHVQRGIDKERKRIRQEQEEWKRNQQKTQQEAIQARDFLARLEAATPEEQLRFYKETPNATAQVERMRQLAAGASGLDAEAFATRIVEGLLRSLEEDDRYAGVDVAAILQEERDVPTALYKLVQAGVEKEQKRMQAEVKKQVEAAVTAELAKRNATAPRPERTVTGTTGPGLTDQQFISEFNAGLRNTSADVKRAAEILERQSNEQLVS